MPWIREVSSVEELEMIPRIWFDYNGKTEWPFIKKKKDIWGENQSQFGYVGLRYYQTVKPRCQVQRWECGGEVWVGDLHLKVASILMVLNG